MTTRSELWTRIVTAQRAGQAVEAQRLIDSAGSSLTDAERAECIGNQLFAQRKFQDAVRQYERAITLEPDHIIARYQYLVGLQQHKAKNYREAFGRFVAAIENEPEFVDPYVELGAMLVTIGDAKGALKCFEDALAKEPNELGHYHNVVTALKELARADNATYGNRLQAAIHRYEEAKKRLPAIAKGHVHDVPRA